MAKRGRKVGSNGERSKAKLLAIAAEEFAEKGYHATKISTIVRRAQVTQPTFYLYFTSKEAIFRELVHSFREKLIVLTTNSRLEIGLEPSTLKDKIIKGLAAIFAYFKEFPNETKIGFFQSSESEQIKKQLARKIEMNLIAEQNDGYFHELLNMRTVAESLVGVIERLTVTQLFEEEKEPYQIAAEVVSLFLFGMQPSTNDLT